jgi:hypothetical protein
MANLATVIECARAGHEAATGQPAPRSTQLVSLPRCAALDPGPHTASVLLSVAAVPTVPVNLVSHRRSP